MQDDATALPGMPQKRASSAATMELLGKFSMVKEKKENNRIFLLRMVQTFTIKQ